MTEKKLNLEPRSLGERYYQYLVNQAHTKCWFVINLCIGAIFFAWYYLSELDMMFVFGLLSTSVSVVYLERHFGYRILKRQQEEIEELRMKLSNKPDADDG